MKVQILSESEQDLLDGFSFYEAQEAGLGDYFLDTLFSDIDSLQIVRRYPCPAFRLLSSAVPAFSLRHLLSGRGQCRQSSCCFGLPPRSCVDSKKAEIGPNKCVNADWRQDPRQPVTLPLAEIQR